MAALQSSNRFSGEALPPSLRARRPVSVRTMRSTASAARARSRGGAALVTVADAGTRLRKRSASASFDIGAPAAEMGDILRACCGAGFGDGTFDAGAVGEGDRAERTRRRNLGEDRKSTRLNSSH